MTVVNPLLQAHVKLPGVFVHVAPKTGHRPLINNLSKGALQYELIKNYAIFDAL